MKRIVFTVFTVLVFNGVALAVNLPENKINKKIFIDKDKECAAEQEAARRECLANGCSEWEAFYFGAAAWGNCMGI